MACTIVSTPALGASDWSGWITQQGLTDRGYSRVSLTNFAGTIASAIGTGSVFEAAGAIYNNTSETAISLATGTASANVAVYIMAIPAAGGTTCTFEIDSIAPTWVDAKQGFYASAASTTRAVGGMYIGTAATYYTKFIYTQDMLTGYLLPWGETRPILKKIIQIGEWDMQSDATIDVPHGMATRFLNVRSINVMIQDDTSNSMTDFNTVSATSGESILQQVFINQINVRLRRDTGGFFDAVAYNATASTIANRGNIYVEFEA